VAGSPVGEKALMMPKVRGEWPDVKEREIHIMDVQLIKHDDMSQNL